MICGNQVRISSSTVSVSTKGQISRMISISGTLVSEEYLMTLERRAFCSLIVHPKTQERIMGMLSTGKPVRN